MKVNFLDLKKQYETIKDEMDEAIARTVSNTAFILGPEVKAFEENFARYCGTRHAIGVSNGTMALYLSLMSLGIGKGDEVITVANTFIATAEAISYTGAKPVLVDMEEKTYTIDVKKIEKAITKKTKAIIPVHLYGQPADMDEILKMAKKHDLHVVEDACQAHSAEYKGRKSGSMGILGCFSFYPGKNLGAYGEGGMIITNSDELADKIKVLRDHGQAKKYHHDMIGYNSRLEGIQGAVLNVKLKHLDDWTEARRKNAKLYNELLKDVDVKHLMKQTM